MLKAEPILRAVTEIRAEYEARGEQIRLLLPSPRGRLFTQAYAGDLAADLRRHVILCGHYEGIDERVRLAFQPEEVSVGDYVLTGGELPALVLIDAAARLVPGVLGDPESVVEESFSDSLLEYPHYTRPAEVRGMTVPDILPAQETAIRARCHRGTTRCASWTRLSASCGRTLLQRASSCPESLRSSC